MTGEHEVPGIGRIDPGSGMRLIEVGGDGRFHAGRDGVRAIYLTGDEKVEFITYADHTLAYVRSAMGHPAIYPLPPAGIEKPVEAVLMDLDGTSVRSEPFWMWTIQSTIAELMGKPGFELEDADVPHVSGHSVSEHLQYCIDKYSPDRSVEEARRIYFRIARREMQAILDGGGRADAFVPAPGLKEFLLALKDRGIKVALVTSGLHEKAWPEITAAFRVMGLGDPLEFYDAIVTAGSAIRPGQAGTLGELEAKPHPWLYAEAARVGLGIAPASRAHCIGLEDSAAGVVAIRLAGFAAIGIEGGNIRAAGVEPLLRTMKASLLDVLEMLR
ncbi:MAG: haloacid dehalogenase [Planctomycetales bacterium 4484_123]|nr:MAG: haloacid dehalogenase [Planctomycetales bacterium 4484_123]